MDTNTDAALRGQLKKLLEGGLQTNWQRRAYDDATIHEVLNRLHAIAREDYSARLKTAGFMPTPYQPAQDAELEQSCSTCMYFESHREHCNLPDVDLPVEPHWSCVLWRI